MQCGVPMAVRCCVLWDALGCELPHEAVTRPKQRRDGPSPGSKRGWRSRHSYKQPGPGCQPQGCCFCPPGPMPHAQLKVLVPPKAGGAHY